MRRIRFSAVVLSVILMIWAVPLCAATGVGYSNSFGIDNTLGGLPPIPSWYKSPYTGPGSVLLRGQLHAHALSDRVPYTNIPLGPDISESALAQLYRDRGYSFVACTNHNLVSGESIGWQGWAPNSCEITKPCGDGHVISVGNSGGTTFGHLDSGSMSGRVNNTHARSGLAFIAHPDALCYGLSVSSLAGIINNSGPEGIAIHSVGSNAETKWAEVMNRLGRPVWGYVEDDYHPDILSRDNLARTWVAVPGEPGEWCRNIKTKLDNGNYYCYWTNGAEWPGGIAPPRLAITTESGDGGRPRIIIGLSGMNLNSANRLEIIGKNGWGLGAVQNPSNTTYAYQCTGYEGWVRVRVWLNYSFGTLNISSQPIRIYKTGSYSPYRALAQAARPANTSPELQIRYLEPDEMPEQPPAAGYVGDVFLVTTADGLVPPGAVLMLSYEGESISPLGGTQYLAIYRYDPGSQQWVKVGGTVDSGKATIESAIDALGIYTISADLPEDTTAPEAFIDNPSYGGVVNQDAAAKVTVNDDLGAWRVRFYMNDHLLSEDADALDGWNATIPTADYCTGDWTLKAAAEDLAGNEGTAEIPIHVVSQTPLPTVSITSPGTGANLSGTATVAGTSWDDVAVASVALYANDTLAGYGELDESGNWTCDIDTTTLSNDATTLTARVEDYPGNSASASVNVTIANGEPCVVPLITAEPVNETICPGSSATFSVTATGTAPLSYQWRKNGKAISGATESSYVTGVAGSYDCVVSNSCGTATSEIAALTVNTFSVSLKAEPPTINACESTVLTWASTCAARLVSSNFGAQGMEGSAEVQPTKTTTYKLTVKSAASKTKSASVTVKVNPVIPKVTLAADPKTITAGQSATLTWTSTNASAVVSSNFGAIGVNGSTQVWPIKTTAYKIVVASCDGHKATGTVTVRVKPLIPTVKLIANPTNITVGQSATLTWTSTNASAVVSSNFGAIDVNGSTTVAPNRTTTYRLTVRSISGNKATSTATVRVTSTSK